MSKLYLKHYCGDLGMPVGVKADKNLTIATATDEELNAIINRLYRERDAEQIIMELRRNSMKEYPTGKETVDTITPINQLYHHGIKGQKWGVRRYQNEDGSLTPQGEKRLDDASRKEKIDMTSKISEKFFGSRETIFGRMKSVGENSVKLANKKGITDEEAKKKLISNGKKILVAQIAAIGALTVAAALAYNKEKKTAEKMASLMAPVINKKSELKDLRQELSFARKIGASKMHIMDIKDDIKFLKRK